MAINYTIDAGEVIKGAAELKIGAYGSDEGDAVAVGATEGGVSRTVSLEYVDTEVDQAFSPIDSALSKRSIRYRTQLAQSSLANLALASGLPTAAVSGSTLKVGKQAPPYVTVWLIGPAPDGAVRTIHAFKCRVTGDSESSYMKADKTVIPIEITVFEDNTQAEDEEFEVITDAAADDTAPTVTVTSPLDAAENVVVTANISWTFSEALQPGTVNADNVYLIKASDGTVIAGALSYSVSEFKVTLDPTASLSAGTAYIAVAGTGIKDLAGNKLAAASVINFTTAA